MIIVEFCFSPGYRKVVRNEGMPISNDQKKRGDLIIAFDIDFPKHLSPDQKQLLVQALMD